MVKSPVFDHPLDRAIHLGDEFDRISVRDYRAQVEIGAFQVERDLTQGLRFDIVVEVPKFSKAAEDDVDSILSYDRLTQAIEQGLARERVNLLETLAETIAEIILVEPQARRVFLRIEKLDRGPGDLGVEIMRDAVGVAPPPVPRPQPTCVLLPNSHEISERVLAAIRQIAAECAPVILIPSLPGALQFPAKTATARIQIDLLALEQAAWAAQSQIGDARVVASLTELDWGLRNDQVSIWAPSKLVLSAAVPPVKDRVEPGDLGLWLGQELAAKGFISLSEDMQKGWETWGQ